MITAMIVVIDEGVDPGFQVAGQIIVLQQDAILERLMPAFDLALCLRVAGRAVHVIHIAFVQPFDNGTAGCGYRGTARLDCSVEFIGKCTLDLVNRSTIDPNRPP